MNANDDAVRYGAQVDVILALLRARPTTNVELADIALKYTSRISELRQRGFRIECRRLWGGVTEYRLA